MDSSKDKKITKTFEHKGKIYSERYGRNTRGSESHRKYSMARCQEFRNKKTMSNLDMYMKLKFEYGVFNISPLEDLTDIYNEYVKDTILTSVLFTDIKNGSNGSLPLSLDVETNFSSFSIPTTVIIENKEGKQLEFGSIGLHVQYELAPFRNITYPSCLSGRCEECGFEIIYCHCANVITVEKLFEECSITKANDLIKASHTYIRNLDTSRFPDLYKAAKWPIIFEVKRLKVKYEIYALDNTPVPDAPEISKDHYSMLFGDHISENIRKYLHCLNYLPCKTVYSMMLEIPVLSAIFGKNYEYKCTEANCCKFSQDTVKFCYEYQIKVLSMMNVEQYLYVLSNMSKVSWNVKKGRRKKVYKM